jgi:amicoumacin kinase
MQLTDISELKKHWDLTTTPVLHRNVANFVYFGKIGERDVVIRLTPLTQRTADEIQAELNWMVEVRKFKILTPNLIKSHRGSLFETVTLENQIFHCVVMEKIDAVRTESDSLDENIILLWSDALARLHLNAPKLKPGAGRAEWNRDAIFQQTLAELPNCPDSTKKLFSDLCLFLEDYPKENYGLIHGDLHEGNFFYKDGQLIIFDFDDCAYHWFIYDLTIPIMSIYKTFDGDSHKTKREEFINLFLENYFKYVPRSKNFKSDFKKFIQFRCLLVHIWLIGIRRHREFSERMQSAFEKAIEEDLFIATHPELFNFISENTP